MGREPAARCGAARAGRRSGLTVDDMAEVRAPVVGVGIDAVDVVRFGEVLRRRPAIVDRVFTPSEQADARRSGRPTERLAARFAAKEAVMKALGRGIGAFALRDVEVVRSSAAGSAAGAPSLRLAAGAARLAEERSIAAWHVSMTHTSTLAVAVVVAQRDPRRANARRHDLADGAFVHRGGSVRAVVTIDQMRAADAEAIEHVGEGVLVERAGTAVALAALAMLDGGYGRRVVVIAGPGNNGADGLVAARVLRRRGARVTVVPATYRGRFHQRWTW